MLDKLTSILYNNRVSSTGFLIIIAAIYLANWSDPVLLTQGESPFFYGSPLPPGAIDQPIRVMIGNSEVVVKG